MARKRKLPTLSESQIEIMDIIWGHGECSVATVWDVLHDRRGVSRNTVHTLIVRLEVKGWLTHREGSNGFFYTATVSREEVQRSSIGKLIDTVFNGSAESLVLTLLDGGPVSKAEADRIRQLISKSRRRKS
jgi:BlaI family transcriptional regulator, penicillinase repressor